MKKIVGLVEADDLNGLSEHLVREIYKLQRAGAVFGVLAANTPHVVFDEVQRQPTIPLIEGLILGGTERPLILRGDGQSIPFLDTAEIHVKSIVAALLAE